ncbi:MAG: hypothetical protein LOX97_01275 [Sphingomonas sp.]|nr:hypothetical protein [Sphingomonas sp.]
MSYWRAWVPAAAIAALVLLPAPAALAAPRVHTVIIDKMKFGQLPTGVKVGDSIRWINRDMVKHTATARDKSFNIDLAPGTSATIRVRHAGSINIYCIYHPGMKAVLKVAR